MNKTNTKKMRGSFAIPLTPFTDENKIDYKVLEKELVFLMNSNVGAVTGPIMASEFEFLSEDERKSYIDAMVSVLKGKTPIIANCSAVNTNLAIKYAEYCEKAGVDLLIAMPPYVRDNHNINTIIKYYMEIHNATGIPIMIQNTDNFALSPNQILNLIEKHPRISWVKQEVTPPSRCITDLLETTGNKINGIISGHAGLYLISDYLRGAAGCAHACQFADIVQQIWNLLDDNKLTEAEDLYYQILIGIKHESTYDWSVYGKYILMKRGIFKNYINRYPGTTFTSKDVEDIERGLRRIVHLFNC